MRKILDLVVVLCMAAFGSFIGIDRSSTTGNVNASPPITLPHFIPEVKNVDPLNLRVDLQTGQLSVENANNGSVNIEIQPEQKIKTVPKYITTKEKEVIYVEDHIRFTRLINKLQPLVIPKLKIPYEDGFVEVHRER